MTTSNAATWDFQKNLSFSEAASEEPFWKAAYTAAFPSFAGFLPNPNDNAAQRLGIDRVVLLNSGQVLRVDEKKRRQDYGDFCLEYESNSKTKVPGWIEKDLAIDYLAYAFMPSRRVYFFPWHLLQRAWNENKAEWKQFACFGSFGFRFVEAKNNGYVTSSVAVPKNRLYAAMNRASIIDVELPEPAPNDEGVWGYGGKE